MASEDTTAPTLIGVEDAAAAGDSTPERLTYEIPEELKGELSTEATEQLKAILDLQKDHDGEHEKMVAEFLALELKYEAIFQTFYAKRSALLTAKENVIPKFWLKAFKNSQIAELIESYDEPILEHLQDVRYEILPGNTGFRLIFQFAPNDYFTNTELTKTLEVDDMFGEEEIVSSKGCTINWKPNKDVTVQLKSKPAPRRGRGGRGRGGRGGASKPVAVKVPSFFRFFEDAPSLENLADDLDEEDFMQIAQQEDVDNQLAQIIREVIISRAAVLFTGEDVGQDEEEEEDPLGGGDDDDDDDDSEEEPVQKPKKKRNNRNRGRGGNQVEEVDSDEDGKKSSAPSLSFPSFGTAPAFNFNFAAGAGTTLGAGAGTSLGGPQRQFNFNPTPAAAAAATSTPPADNKSA